MTDQGSYVAIVLYYRAGPVVWDTLRDLQRQSLVPKEVILVDNGSGDGVCEKMPADVEARLVTSGKNLGYSGGMALGVAHVTQQTAWVLLSTHEVRLPENCLRQLVDEANTAGAAQAGPAVLDSASGAVWSLGGSLTRSGKTTHEPNLRQGGTATRRVTWLEGCFHLIRRDLIREELFDTRYFLYWDDVDISTQLSVAGPILCVPTAQCTQGTSGQITYFASRNRVAYWLKQNRRPLVASAIVGAVLRAFRATLRARDLDSAKSHLVGALDGLTGRLSDKYWSSRTR